jgi:hypothetical protein
VTDNTVAYTMVMMIIPIQNIIIHSNYFNLHYDMTNLNYFPNFLLNDKHFSIKIMYLM